jgi:hypothetical protein
MRNRIDIKWKYSTIGTLEFNGHDEHHEFLNHDEGWEDFYS